MKIIKEDITPEWKKPKRFECPNCTCIFEEDPKECIQNFNEFNMVTVYMCSCPNCGCMCTADTMRDILSEHSVNKEEGCKM